MDLSVDIRNKLKQLYFSKLICWGKLRNFYSNFGLNIQNNNPPQESGFVSFIKPFTDFAKQCHVPEAMQTINEKLFLIINKLLITEDVISFPSPYSNNTIDINNNIPLCYYPSEIPSINPIVLSFLINDHTFLDFKDYSNFDYILGHTDVLGNSGLLFLSLLNINNEDDERFLNDMVNLQWKITENLLGFEFIHVIVVQNNLSILSRYSLLKLDINRKINNDRTQLSSDIIFINILNHFNCQYSFSNNKISNIMFTWSPLHIACYCGYFAVVDYLLQQPDIKLLYTKDNLLPYHVAQLEILPLLYSYTKSLRIHRNEYPIQKILHKSMQGNETQLFEAVFFNDLPTVLQYLDEGISPNSLYPFIPKYSIYHISCILYQDNMIILYVSYNFIVNQLTLRTNWNGLHCCLHNKLYFGSNKNKISNKSQLNTISLLLSLREDPNICNNLGQNTLTVLCNQIYNVDILSLLLLWGVDSQIDESTGKHPIHGLIFDNNLPGIRVMISLLPYTVHLLYSDMNPIKLAFDQNNLYMFILLVNYGGDIESKQLLRDIIYNYSKPNKPKIEEIDSMISSMRKPQTDSASLVLELHVKLAPECILCKAQFNMLSVKYVCKSCGLLFCSNCIQPIDESYHFPKAVDQLCKECVKYPAPRVRPEQLTIYQVSCPAATKIGN